MNPRRLALYAGGIVALYAAFLFALAFNQAWIFGPGETSLPSDFLTFWAAARLAVEGRAAEAYAQATLLGVQEAALGRRLDLWLPWVNPPTFFLAIFPLGWLSYRVAFFAWTGLQVALFVVAFRAILPGAAPMLAAFALPPILVNVALGQNGLLIAALFAAFLVQLEKHPVRAGVLLGLLTLKPQFGLLWPVLLLVGGHRRAFTAAAGTALALAALATLAFGTEAWLAFLEGLGVQSNVLAAGAALQLKAQSAYGLSIVLTRDAQLASFIHAGVALCVAALVIRAWWQPGIAFDIRASLGVSASFLVSPYGLIYDGVSLAVAGAFLVRHGLAHGFRRGDAALIFLAAALPAFAPLEGPFRFTFAAWVVIFAVALRHARPVSPP